MQVRVEPVATRADRERFIEFPYELNARDPVWVPPLRMEIRKQLDPRKNPFFRHADTQLLVARANGKVVGRASAHVDHRHNEVHKERLGMFGFFESVDDPAVAEALVGAAAEWVDERGMDRLRGPLSWSMHEYLGVLVDGFDTPPAILMNHNPPYYDAHLKGAGLRKAKDLLAYRFFVDGVPEHILEAYEATKGDPNLKVRPVNMKRFREELGIVFDIYNEAWRDNWGFVAITQDEIEAIAGDLKMLVDPNLALIAEVDGRPAGMAIAVPNINEAIKDLKGRSGPVALGKLLWRLKRRGLRSGRLFLLGIKREFRGPYSFPILMALYGRLTEHGKRHGYEWGELSWALEDNKAVNNTILQTGSELYKTYRLYEMKV